MYIKCQLCEKDSTSLIKKENHWSIVQCKNCGFVYVNPRPDEEHLRRCYQNYLPTEQDKLNSWRRMMSGVFLKSLEILEKCYPIRSGRLLDIGCGHGFFLQMAREKGWKGSGIDISESAVSYAKSKGMDVSSTTLFKKAYDDEEFDAVTMFYVLEHLLEPVKYLQEVHRILKPKGLLLVRVPHTTPIAKILNILRIPNRLYTADYHLSDFSPQTIRQVLRKTGFKNVRIVIGGATYPEPLAKRFTSCFFGGLAAFLSAVTFGKYLLPGVSKTAIAEK